jgi:hypothetical protein
VAARQGKHLAAGAIGTTQHGCGVTETSFWVIVALLLLILLWFLWTMLKVYLRAKGLEQIERDANRIGKRLAELSCASTDPSPLQRAFMVLGAWEPPDPHHIEIYKGLAQKVNLQELWARVGTRIDIWRKPKSEVLNWLVSSGG